MIRKKAKEGDQGEYSKFLMDLVENDQIFDLIEFVQTLLQRILVGSLWLQYLPLLPRF